MYGEDEASKIFLHQRVSQHEDQPGAQLCFFSCGFSDQAENLPTLQATRQETKPANIAGEWPCVLEREN